MTKIEQRLSCLYTLKTHYWIKYYYARMTSHDIGICERFIYENGEKTNIDFCASVHRMFDGMEVKPTNQYTIEKILLCSVTIFIENFGDDI